MAFRSFRTSTPARDYAFAVAAIAVATAVAFAIFPYFALTNLVMVYLVATLAVAARGRRGPAALASVANVLLFDFFFVPPRFTFRVSDAQYVVTFAVMFLTAMIISHLTIRLRAEAEAARQGQTRTAMMHSFTQQLATVRGLHEVLLTAVHWLAETFDSTVVAFAPNKESVLGPAAQSDGEVSEKDQGVAQWVYDQGKPAGFGAAALPSEDALFVPLVGKDGKTVGVLRVRPNSKESLDSSEKRQLLDSFSHQIALAMEVERLQDSTQAAQMDAETERMRSSLLSSVSHDFRTPLTAIVGSASALLTREEIKKSRPALELTEAIQGEAERLSRLVQNLLETTRFESGGLRVRKELYPLEEIIGSALERLAALLKLRTVKVELPSDLPPVPLDAVLLEQVFINLVENAARHTAPESAIKISAKANSRIVTVEVVDRGPGISPDELERIFDKFYHGKNSPGAGLGLAICRAVVNAHGGRIWAENRNGGGAAFQFTLPLGEP